MDKHPSRPAASQRRATHLLEASPADLGRAPAAGDANAVVLVAVAGLLALRSILIKGELPCSVQFLPIADHDQGAQLREYLNDAREAILWKCEGLSDAQARTPLTPTGTHVMGLLLHLL
ncbi:MULTISPECIES: mycothiol transferase [Paenarthrobacter]|uniref:mycothiol transferase n=1 Tax=Paenarthrobacter TaxID=1742992 RepID=UPI002366CD94|nr:MULTISPECIES: DUF664 domain-containing protein [Paenarthrobacter]MDD7835622.1 DUF664 domain-containing protein [Paenarthrobacter sp. AB444]